MKPAELLSYPVDADGNAELYLRLSNENGRIGSTSGKLKVSCCYDYYNEVPLLPTSSTPSTTELVKYSHAPRGFANTTTALHLPIVVHVLTISVVDLKRVHGFLIPNSPRVNLVCDRKNASTKVLSNAGAHGRWSDLNWPVPVAEGSFFLISVTSGGAVIGKLELPANSLIEIPPNQFSISEVSLVLISNDMPV
jgi:hypothetical protein